MDIAGRYPCLETGTALRGIRCLCASLRNVLREEAGDVVRDSAVEGRGRSCVRRTRDAEAVRLVRRLRTEGNRRVLRVAGLPRRGADGGRGWTVRGGRRRLARPRVRHTPGRRA